MKVFIAESSKFGLHRLLMFLNDVSEFEFVGYAITPTSAIVSIDVIKPEVVILDLELQGGLGFEVIREIKRRQPSVVFIVLTNAATEQYRTFCRELGAEFFFDRSTEFDKIPPVLRAIQSHR